MGHGPAGNDEHLHSTLDRVLIYIRNELAESPVDALPMGQTRTLAHFDQMFRQSIRLLAEQVAGRGELPDSFDTAGTVMCRMLVASATLEDAIENLMKLYSVLDNQSDTWGLEVRGDTVLFFYGRHPCRKHSPASALVLAIGVRFFSQLFGWLIGENQLAKRIFLTHALAEEALPLLALFNAPVDFASGYYGFEFDAPMLRRAVIRRVEDLNGYMESYPCRFFGTVSGPVPLSRQIRPYLDAALAKRETLPGASAIASVLGISEATLRRRLRVEGTSFDNIRNEVLRDAAAQFLGRQQLRVDQVSELLGFSNSKTFRRAFYRWFNCSPSEFRKGLVAEPGVATA